MSARRSSPWRAWSRILLRLPGVTAACDGPTLQSTTMRPVSTTMGPVSTTMGPVSTTMGPVPTSVGPVPTSMGPVSTSMGPVSTSMGPVPTTMGPVPIRTKNRKALAFDEEKEQVWAGPFCFIQAADTQLGMIDSFVNKVDEVSVTWDAELRRTRAAIEAANQMSPKPRFFIVCGDLVDAMPGTMHRRAQEKDWNEVFDELDNTIPLLCVCGNHDLGNRPTAQTIQDFVKAFGSDDYFTFWCGGVFNIVLNSQFFADCSQVPDLAEEHMAWIDQQLAEVEKKAATHVLIFQHIPFFLRKANEKKEYFNLEKKFRLRMLDKFADAGVKAVFCGHYHRNAGGSYRGLEEVVTTAIGAALGDNEPSGLRVVCVYQDRLEHKYYPLDQIPQRPELLKN